MREYLGKVLLLNGPNLNLAHIRNKNIYGGVSLHEIESRVRLMIEAKGLRLDAVQTNEEGTLITHIHSCVTDYHGLIINPGGYTHTSVAIRDALELLAVPIIEVHLSNIQARERFRSRSLIASVVWGRIEGFGIIGYELAAQALLLKIADNWKVSNSTNNNHLSKGD